MFNITKGNGIKQTILPHKCQAIEELIAVTQLLINTPANAHTQNIYIETIKIAPTCFDTKVIFRELHCSFPKSH